MIDMSNNGDNTRQDVPPAATPGSRKTRPRTQAPEQLTDHGSGDLKKPRRKSTTVINLSGDETTRNQSPSHVTRLRERLGNAAIETPASSEKTGEPRSLVGLPDKDTGSQAKPPSVEAVCPFDTSKSDTANESEGSSGSSQTVTRASPARRNSWAKGTTSKQRRHNSGKPHALHFLDVDSPQVTSESIQRTMKEASKSPQDTAKSASSSTRSPSSTSSGFREDIFDVTGERETDQTSTSPSRSLDGDTRGSVSDEARPRSRITKGRRRSYGTPEMPRGNAQHPHVPPEDLTPRAPNQQFIKPLPRAEKLPLTGYELLASRLSITAVDHCGQFLRPIYRRFESLNHRMLLHLQDEICELEEELHHLDTADTQNRRLPNGILPASRRADYVSGGELQWRRIDIMGKIGFKLEQYNRVLTSFRETLSLSVPTLDDVQQYRMFLESYAPITEVEGQFLDTTNDLVCLGYSDEDMEADDECPVTPRSDTTDLYPRRRVSILSQSDVSRQHDARTTSSISQQGAPQEQPVVDRHPLTSLSVAIAMAVILPIFTFLVIPGFIGRMTVVCLVGIGILGALIQGKVIRLQATQEFCVSVGLYGGVMAILAGMVG
ncbi:hypothetical protein SAMD00023353_4800780 [Rosellinia necatrix]|uniref:DUF6594 domain-containing protein n=1 Tax=Rosellinia necatrix TaxID=77044 RepID=A0A1W2TQA0_ROSNE|nr:hypothetical protein SAMD00023353_4800780 [Rosellinia necatrix]